MHLDLTEEIEKNVQLQTKPKMTDDVARENGKESANGESNVREISGPDTGNGNRESDQGGFEDDSVEDGSDSGYHRRGDRPDYRRDGGYDRGRGRSGRGDRPMTAEEKFRAYKRQSDERLLDIKRSRENKIGKKRKR